MSDLSGRLSGSQAISGSLSGGSVLRGGLSMGGGVSPELLLDKADVITDTASGSIVSIPDGMASPVLGLSVDIEPIQDLHGYDYPWPAGGGKNLIDSRVDRVKAVNTNGTWNGNTYTLNGLTFTVADDGHIVINGTSTANTYFTVYRNSDGITVPAGSYVLHKSGSADIIVATPKNGSYWTSATTSDSVVTLNESAMVSYYVQIQNGKTISNYVLYPMFESGSTATSWTPYSNICPISGRSEVNVYVEESYDPQATPKATIQLGQTVYGGSLDVTNGVLTVDKFLYVYDGTEPFNKSGTALNGFYNNLSGSWALPHDWPAMVNYFTIPNIADEISSMFAMTRDGNAYKQNYGLCYLDSGMNFDAPPETFGTTVDSFKAKLAEFYSAGTPVSVFAKIATPIVYTLTPQQIATLLGTNNIWADSGDITVEYRCDTKKYILKKIAEALNA